MPKKGLNVSLQSYDDIFSTEESRQNDKLEHVQQIPLEELHPFKNHPFKVIDDESMLRTVESIAQFGVLSPAIARPSPDGGYELISGHRRHHAAELAGLASLPVIVRDMPKFDMRQLTDYDQMKNTLVVQVIPTDRNQDMLANIPHKEIEDMSVVYRMQLDSSEKGTSSVLMTNAMLENYGVTPEQLHQDAMEATVMNNPATFRSMADVMRDLMGPEMFDLMPPIDMGGPQMYVASVESGVNGAGVIAYPNFMDKVAEEMGGDFFVLPSSVHEVLVLPDNGDMDRHDLEMMVREVNSTEVQPQDQLSDNVYHYDSQDKVFELAASFEDRMAVKEQAMEYGSGTEPEKDTINVLLVEPNCYPKEVAIGTGLEDLQKAVGGNIEVTYPFEDNVGLIMNEEGKLEGLPLNRAIRDDEGQIVDVVAGSFLVVGLTEDSFGSLSPDQIKTFEDTFHQPEAFVKMGKGIMAVPIPDNVVKEMEKDREKPPKEKAKPSKSQDVLS